MANAKITALTSMTTAVASDVLAIVDDPSGSPVTQKITYANLIASFASIGQLPFPATQLASGNANTFDDYEEGTFTPTFAYATPGTSSWVHTTQAGRYLKIGTRVFCTMTVNAVPTNGTASSFLRITGLPFTAINTGFYGNCSVQGFTKANYTWVQMSVNNLSTNANLTASGSGQPESPLSVTDIPTGGTVIVRGTLMYEV